MNYIHLLLLVLIFVQTKVFAEKFEQKWGAIADAKLYELEISQDPNFQDEAIIRQEETKKTEYQTDLPAGVYFMRIRGIDFSGKAGPWSPVTKKTIRGNTPTIKTPLPGEIVETSGPSTLLAFEWKSVKDADDYMIEVLKPGEKKKSVFYSLATTFTFASEKEGLWKLWVAARVRGQVVSESAQVGIEIKFKKLPPPRILFPQDNEVLTSFESYKLRWTRLVEGRTSIVEVRRVSSDKPSGRVMKWKVSDDSTTEMPPLTKGNYQVTVTDLLMDDEEKSPRSTDTTSFRVEDDPRGYHSQYMGLTWKFFEGGAGFGRRSLTNDQISTAAEKISDFPALVQAYYQTAMSVDVYNNWGADILFQVKTFSFSNTEGENNGYANVSSKLFMNKRLDLGVTYLDSRLGLYWPLRHKLAISYKRLNQLHLPNPASQSVNYLSSDYGLLGFVLGTELRWFGWKSRYDFSTLLQTELPLMTDKGSLFGRGNPRFFIPYSIESKTALRRKLGDFHRLSIGFRMHAESLSVSEKPAVHLGVESRNSRTVWREWSWGPYLGWEWDL
jgi:hypothetical protein